MTLQLSDNGTPRDLTNSEVQQVALDLGLSRGWSNLHGFYSHMDVGVDFLVWPGFALSSPGSARGGAALGAGTAYIGGARVRYAGGDVATQATMDHYLDVDIDGVLTVGVVAVGVAPPPRPPNSIRVARYTTNATQIASVAQNVKDLGGNWLGNYVSMPFAHSVRTTSVSPSVGTSNLTFPAGTTVYDNNSMHDEATLTERFFAVLPGLYSINAGVKFAASQASQVVSIGIRKDGGTDAIVGDASGDPSLVQGLNVSGLVAVTALSYFALTITNASAVSVASSHFQLAKVA